MAETCQKKRVLIDVRVIAEFPHATRYLWDRTEEGRAKALEGAVREFEEFLRDHRSQDVVNLDIDRVYQDQCSACGKEWEPYTEDGITSCVSCGATVEAPAKAVANG